MVKRKPLAVNNINEDKIEDKIKKVRPKRVRIRSDKPIFKFVKINLWVRTTKQVDPKSKRFDMFIVREMDKNTAFINPGFIQKFTTKDVFDNLIDVIEDQYPTKNVTLTYITNIMQRLKNEGFVSVSSNKTKIEIKPSSEWKKQTETKTKNLSEIKNTILTESQFCKWMNQQTRTVDEINDHLYYNFLIFVDQIDYDRWENNGCPVTVNKFPIIK